MQASTHKKIVMAGCGCGVLLGAVVVAGIVVALIEDPDFLKRELGGEDFFAPARAVAALDSLRDVDWTPLRRGPAADGYTVPVLLKGNGAATAFVVWTDTAFYRGFLAFGDTLPDGDRRRRRWVDAADWEEVDSLRHAAMRRWEDWSVSDDVEGTDSVRGLLPQRVLTTTRAVLARARMAEVRGDAGEADTLTRAVITIGRHLQRDHRLYFVLLGARAEHEALIVLRGIEEQGGRRAATARTEAALAHAKALARETERGYRLLTAAGAAPENCAALAALARDAALPMPVRHAAVHAIGFGWAFSSVEQTRVDGRRAQVLTELAEANLPKDLRAAVQFAQGIVALPLLRRFAVGTMQQFMWQAWRVAG